MIITSISHRPYGIAHFIWTISYGPYIISKGNWNHFQIWAGLTWLDFEWLEHDLIIRTPVPFITFVFLGTESFALLRFWLNITLIISYGLYHIVYTKYDIDYIICISWFIVQTTLNPPEQILFKFTSGLPIISQSCPFLKSFFTFWHFILCNCRISEWENNYSAKIPKFLTSQTKIFPSFC